VIATSTTASLRPNLSTVPLATRSVIAGFRRKSMCRLVVTASSAGPICASIATHAVVSASIIIRGPDTVPPGRS
jgi:hypothetical protein